MSSPATSQSQHSDTTPSGILIIDKPIGWTSHDVVAKVRRYMHTKKVGHAGTLDPMASGVLVVLVGKATKLSDQLLNQDKLYQASLLLGQQTDTGDADGQIINQADAAPHITTSQVERAAQSLLGDRQQQVPAYSAVKVNGQKLYNLARQGRELADRPTRSISIHSLTIDQLEPAETEGSWPTIHFTTHCSKGTYVRVLGEELAANLQTIGHLTALRRLASGQFTIDQAVTLDQLGQSADPRQFLLPLPQASA